MGLQPFTQVDKTRYSRLEESTSSKSNDTGKESAVVELVVRGSTGEKRIKARGTISIIQSV